MKVITIGRSEENDVVVRDPHASRHHLQIIQHDDGHFTLSDFGSTNGTYVNGQKIRGEIYLNMNDVVRIGNTVVPWRLYFEEGWQETTQINTPPQYGANVTEPSNPTMPVNKERHGFVTFWLWLGIVSSALGIILNLFTYQNLTNLGYLGMDFVSKGIDITPFSEAIRSHILIWQIVSVIGGVCLIICYSLLLKWKKIGFWGAVVTAIIIAIVNVIMINLVKQDYMSIGLSLNLNPIIQVIVTPISLIILWAILQIKKNGVSCWNLLEYDRSVSEKTQGLKKTWLWVIIVGIVTIVVVAMMILLCHQSSNQTCTKDAQSAIQSELSACNLRCPMDMGNNLTLTKVELKGQYVVYDIMGTEEMFFSQDFVTSEMKNQLVQTLQIKAQNDPSVEKFIAELKKENIGVIYHYFNSLDMSMDVIIESSEL